VTDPDTTDEGQPLTAPEDTTEGPRVDATAFAPDGRTLAMVTFKRRVHVWDLTALPDREPLASFVAPAGACEPTCSQLAIHPNGRMLAMASSKGGAWLWRIGPHAGPLGHVPMTGVGLRGIAFSPDGRLLATAEEGGRIVLWDLADPAKPAPLGVVRTGSVTYALNGSWIAFSMGTRLIATAGPDNTAVLYDISDPHRPRHVSSVAGQAESVSSVSFSPDGSMLATASADQTTALWDLRHPQAPRLAGRLRADLEVPHRATFAPDGHTVATTAQPKGQRLLLWETDFHRLTTHVCDTFGAMGRDRWNRYFPGIEYQDPCAA
jgi:WD40 repeat protein